MVGWLDGWLVEVGVLVGFSQEPNVNLLLEDIEDTQTYKYNLAVYMYKYQ